ncbi:DNA-binding CsgD family transcriptional regulator [Sphingobium xanthum]|jgi:DNA-binding CsgD family transcriptional regulator|uniref:helix-turn-helix transcriptional regulator n=1 Tax=Sphingobium xanthum TaxID=1387165 RepID=UPI001C8B4249|nr:LuxR C-terminal-related transcriptional regulator [Sphingobium xanthum]
MTDRAVVDACADLVGAIGSERFPARFHAALGTLAAIDLSSVFRHDEGKSVQLLFAQGTVPFMADFPMHASLDYARRYWRSDRPLLRLARSGRTAPIVVRTSAAEIADPDYRAACYERASVRERVSIYWPGQPMLVANGYRTGDSPIFSAEELERIELHAGLLMAALERHAHLQTVGALPHSEAELVQSLMELNCGLSAREAEVSAAMILGETQTEIATRKRLSHGSVVTYRRRAYGKLGVANRRDLLRLHRRLATGEG